MVDDLVEHALDLSQVYAHYTEVRGAPPYDPRLMLKILIDGDSHAITSSRVLERRCQDDLAFRFLTAQAAPDFVAIARFRTRHGQAPKQMFVQPLGLCTQASRHRAMSYDRMVRAEAELLPRSSSCRGRAADRRRRTHRRRRGRRLRRRSAPGMSC